MNTNEILDKGLYRLLNSNIYRYRNFQQGLEMIEKLELYLSNPIGFNDPFDCYEGLVDFKVTKEFEREYLTKTIGKMGVIQREQRRKVEKQTLKNPQLLRIEEFFESQKKQFGICCFSWDNKSIVMWAHYADNHKGICIGIKNLNPVQEGLYGIYSVNYVSEIKKYQFTSFDDEKYWEHWLLTKSSAWEYEKEVRLISKSYNGKLKFPKEAITEIYLGLLVSKENENKVIESLVMHNFTKDIKLYRMTIDKKTFSLLPKELNWTK